jgi:hypothetical protein
METAMHEAEARMDPRLMWTLVAVIVAAAVVAGLLIWRKRRSQNLRARFGPEYDHAVRNLGDVGKAEASLEARAKRVERLHIRPMPAAEVGRVKNSWRRVQEQFVDDPQGAIAEADRLVGEVMAMRGYPLGDFDRRVEDISVDHADVVMNYRAAHDIALQQSRGAASTEDLRQAMVHYRVLFREMLETDEAEPHPKGAKAEAGRKR